MSSAAEDQPRDHWFEDLADHLGRAYLRYSFTRGTEGEIDFLVGALDLKPGDRVLDVGCGPGRHAHALGRRGIQVLGVDISQRFVDVASADAPPGVRFERMDARALPFEGEFDAVISLCQGAFGLAGGPERPRGGVAQGGMPGSERPCGGVAQSGIPRSESGSSALDPDGRILDGIARAARSGGRVAVSAFSAYFQVRFLEVTDSFDAATGVNHERTILRDEDGAEAEHDLWTSCFTPRELRLLASRAGLEVDVIHSVTPGAYRAGPPDLDQPELLLLGHRPLPAGSPERRGADKPPERRGADTP